MSSTNRTNSSERHVSDYYRTPIQDIVNFLYNWPYFGNIKKNSLILDPCSGGDGKNLMSYPEAIFQANSEHHNTLFPDYIIETLDVREDSRASFKGDYLSFDVNKFIGEKPDIIITNPPFSHALEITQKAIEDIKDDGYVIMLLRLNFFGSKKRFNFFKNNAPEYCFVHSKRMTFTDDGATDSIEYAHFIWRKTGYNFTKTKVI
jgi:hypothetical protein